MVLNAHQARKLTQAGTHLFRALFLLAALALVSCRCSAQAMVRHYEGGWTNLTFNSTGLAVVEISVEGTHAVVRFDLDGFVFGAFDPPLVAMPGAIENDVMHLDSRGVGELGDIQGTIDLNTGVTAITLTNIPGGLVSDVQLTGNIIDFIDLDYTIRFVGDASPTNPARGVLIAYQTEKPSIQITSIQVANQELVVTWAGGTPPYQVQTSAKIVSSTWQNLGAATMERQSRFPLGSGPYGFIRVTGQ